MCRITTGGKATAGAVCGVLLAAVLIVVATAPAGAVPAPDQNYTKTQPDGTQFRATQWGTASMHGWETTAGYTIVTDEAGYWTYARKADGRLVATDHRVTSDVPPESIEKHLRPAASADPATYRPSRLGSEALKPEGTVSLPVVMVNYNDTTTSYSPSAFQQLLFGDDPAIATGPGSLTDYYEEVSYGEVTVTGTVYGWVTANRSHDYYGRNKNDSRGDKRPQALARAAARKADDRIDFSEYDRNDDGVVDQFVVIHQGAGEEMTGNSKDIWSHFSRIDYRTDDNVTVKNYVMQPASQTLTRNTTTMSTIGVFAHELGHAFGLPDLYDTDYSSQGIGAWGLMASGNWNSIEHPGDSPAHLSAWSKQHLGWTTPRSVALGDSHLDDESIAPASEQRDYYQLRTWEETSQPRILTRPPENVTAHSATFRASIANMAGAQSAETSFTYWENGNKQATARTVEAETLHSGDFFTTTVDGLDAGTTYVVQGNARTERHGLTTGDTESFTTGEPSSTAPVVEPAGSAANKHPAPASEDYERFLVANRQRSGFDRGLPGSGLLIWHVDGTPGDVAGCIVFNDCNQDETEKLVDLEAADGEAHLDQKTGSANAGDTWTSGSFDSSSTPSSRFQNGAKSGVRVANIRPGTGSTYVADLRVGKSASDAPATVTIDDVTDVGRKWATIHGRLERMGTAKSVSTHLDYWVKGEKDATRKEQSIDHFWAPTTFTTEVEGLQSGTTYVFQLRGGENTAVRSDTVTVQTDTEVLTDVDGYPFESEIRRLVDEGVVSGYGDQTFRPNRTLTRAEYAAMLENAFDLEPSAPRSNFTDVEGHWAESAIRNAGRTAFLSGYPDGTFRPDEKISKVEVIVSLSNGLNYTGGRWEAIRYIYEDPEKIPAWARQPVADAHHEWGLIRSIPDNGHIDPMQNVTRGVAAKYVYDATH